MLSLDFVVASLAASAGERGSKDLDECGTTYNWRALGCLGEL